MISIATALICSAKARHSDDLKSFEKQSEGLARQSTAKEMQSTDQIGKGSALFRNDTKSQSLGERCIESDGKAFTCKATEMLLYATN